MLTNTHLSFSNFDVGLFFLTTFSLGALFFSFIYSFYFLVAMGLRWCRGIPLDVESVGYSLVICSLLPGVASPVAEHRLWGMWASVALARGLSSCSSEAVGHSLRSCGTQA